MTASIEEKSCRGWNPPETGRGGPIARRGRAASVRHLLIAWIFAVPPASWLNQAAALAGGEGTRASGARQPVQDVAGDADRANPRTLTLSRFRFVHRPGTRQVDNERIELPATDFGEMLLDAATGRCVYRLWFDGINERARLGRVNNIYRDADTYTRDQYRTVLKAASGMDGTAYWAAAFSDAELDNGCHAKHIAIYEDRNALKQNDSPLGFVADKPTWFNYATVHEFVATVGGDSFDGVSLRSNLTKYRFAKKLSGDSFSVKLKIDDLTGDPGTWQRWQYVAKVGNGPVGILHLDVSVLGGGTRWEKPVPVWFTIVRDDDVERDADEFQKMADWHSYADDDTRITRYSAKK